MNLLIWACISTENATMLFNKKKYFALAIAVLLLILGFVLMSGPANSSADSFNADIFNFRRITLAPVVILTIYTGLIFLILKQPKQYVRKKD